MTTKFTIINHGPDKIQLFANFDGDAIGAKFEILPDELPQEFYAHNNLKYMITEIKEQNLENSLQTDNVHKI